MKKLFLSSAFANSSQYVAEFIGQTTKGLRVTFINTASLHEEYKGYLASAAEVFNELGIEIDYLEISSVDLNQAIALIRQNELLYIAGGNTFFLLQELKREGLDQIIKEEIEAGKLYLGESAGSIIMSPNIEYIHYMDDRESGGELDNYAGLNLIDTYPVPHLGHDYLNQFGEKIIGAYQDLALVPLTDQQVLIVEGEQQQVI